MKKTCKKILTMMIVMTMLVSSMTMFANASELANGNTWRADDMRVEIEAGEDSYNYMVVGYAPPAAARKDKIIYYETSNHAIKKEVTSGGAVHLVTVVDTKENAGEWTPSGVYVSGESNYNVMYCCDADKTFAVGAYYKKVTLEDSEYFTKDQAEKLRAILMNSYPYVTVEEMKDFLKTQGFEYAEQLDRSEIISAVQAAVWAISNPNNGDSFDYNATVSTYRKLVDWGGYMHEYAAEITNFTDSTTKKTQKVYAEIGTRINSLRDFLMAMEPVAAADNQTTIAKIEILECTPSVAQNGTFTTTLQVALNNAGSSENDSVKIDIYVDGVVVKTENVVPGTTEYQFTVDARVGQNIKAVVSGMQDLPSDVYFFAPRAADVDGDGLATVREAYQKLIAVSSGMTEVYADAQIVVPNETELTVNKIWNDGDNRDGIRPESVTIRLLADGTEVAFAVLNAENNWKYTFANIPVINGEGALINYTVSEDEVPGYEAVIDQYSVTNVHQPELIIVAGEKTWDDADNADGIRPESITINLLANGQIIDTKVVTEADEWAWSFENLFKYENGEEIVYTIAEEAVAGYQTTVDGFNVTNTHVPSQDEVDDPEVPLGPGEEVDDPEVPLGPGNLPDTGDFAEMSKWIATGLTSVAALAGISVASFKAKKREED